MAFKFDYHGDLVPAPRPQVGKRGVYYPKPYQRCHASIRAQALEFWGCMAPLEGAVFVHMTVRVTMPVSWSAKKREQMHGQPKLTRPDVDNLAKTMLDALSGIVWLDDKQVYHLSVRKLWSLYPGTHVIINDYETEDETNGNI